MRLGLGYTWIKTSFKSVSKQFRACVCALETSFCNPHNGCVLVKLV